MAITASSSSPVPTISIKNEIFCANCNKGLDSSFIFCPSCGFALSKPGEKHLITDSKIETIDEFDEEEYGEIEEYQDVKTNQQLLKAPVKYIGGHSMNPTKKELNTTLEMRDTSIFIEKISLSIPYRDMENIENMSKERISKLRVIGLGLIFLPLAIVGALWKKKKLYTVIEYNDKIQQQKIVLDFGKNVGKMQQAIYAKMIESRSRNKKS